MTIASLNSNEEDKIPSLRKLSSIFEQIKNNGFVVFMNSTPGGPQGGIERNGARNPRVPLPVNGLRGTRGAFVEILKSSKGFQE